MKRVKGSIFVERVYKRTRRAFSTDRKKRKKNKRSFTTQTHFYFNTDPTSKVIIWEM